MVLGSQLLVFRLSPLTFSVSVTLVLTVGSMGHSAVWLSVLPSNFQLDFYSDRIGLPRLRFPHAAVVIFFLFSFLFLFLVFSSRVLA